MVRNCLFAISIKSLLFTFLLVAWQVHALAQSSQVWTEYMLNMPTSKAWNVEFASTYATVLQPPKWRSLDAQITPEFALNKHVDIMSAFFYGETFQNKLISTSELRGMIGTRLHFTPDKRLLTRLLVRFEQRNLQDQETKVWTHSNRARLRAEGIMPINSTTLSGNKVWYCLADAEAFFVMNNDVKERFANRLRIRAAVGYRFNYNLRLELMYTLQQSKNTIDGDFYTSDHIFRIRIKQFLNAHKESTLGGIGN